MAPGPDSLEATRAYYDEFSARYDAERRPNRPEGYHALVDNLELELVERHGSDADVLECGVGTGLLLERVAAFARSSKEINLSDGMLAKARERGLDVRQASVTAIPFDDASFDVTYAFKVLAHVADIGGALSEMARVTRPGGVVLAEFYNPMAFAASRSASAPRGTSPTRRARAPSSRASIRPGASPACSRRAWASRAPAAFAS